MKRFAFVIATMALAAGCGDDGGTQDLQNAGFATPMETTEAWSGGDGIWDSQGAADWSCLNTPSDDVASTVEITLTGNVNDFQTGEAVPNAELRLFHDVDVDNPFATVTADGNGDYTVTLPVGTTRFGYEMNADGQMRTLLLNQKVDPGEANQTLNVSSVSELTANALPAFIGVTRTDGRGVLAGAIRDCNENEVSNAVATVSSVSGSPEHLDTAECADKPCTQTYYFSAGSTSLPQRHAQVPNTNRDGLFMAIELPVQNEAYLQV